MGALKSGACLIRQLTRTQPPPQTPQTRLSLSNAHTLMRVPLLAIQGGG